MQETIGPLKLLLFLRRYGAEFHAEQDRAKVGHLAGGETAHYDTRLSPGAGGIGIKSSGWKCPSNSSDLMSRNWM